MSRRNAPARGARRVLVAGVSALALAAAVVALPTASWANNGYAQVWSHDGSVTGLGLTDKAGKVSNIEMDHDEGAALLATVCGYQAKAWGTLYSGAAYSKVYGYHSGCVWHSIALGTQPNVLFRLGSWVYVQAYHDGSWRPGTPRVEA